MPTNGVTQQTSTFSKHDQSQENDLSTWVEAFLVDRKAQNLTPGSIRYYRQKIKLFTDYCDSQVVTRVSQITPDFIRHYLLYLADTHHNAGGCHSAYRSLRAFLIWYENEAEPEGWKNPIHKVKAPRVSEDPLEPVDGSTVKAMVEACPSSSFTGLRDQALLWFLLDTGVRAMECLSLNRADVDQTTGVVLIRHSKSRKPRDVFMGKKARRAYRAYLKLREDQHPAAWLNVQGERLKYNGLRAMLDNRARQAGVPAPSAHAFRRAFALTMLRNGTDLITLARLMGHRGLSVLQKYLRQVSDDMREAHRRGGPVDHLGEGGAFIDPDE